LRTLVLDVVRVVALLVAGSACLQPRYRLGLVIVLAIALIDTPTMVLPIIHRDAAPPTLFYAFVLIFWGPSGMPAPTTAWPALNVVDENPIVRTAVTSALALLAMSRAYRHSKPLRPEILEARLWDGIGLRFLFVGIVESLLVVVGILLRYLSS
jgi:hypothetical protein